MITVATDISGSVHSRFNTGNVSAFKRYQLGWNATGAVSSQHPRDVIARMSGVSTMMSRGCYEETAPVEFQNYASLYCCIGKTRVSIYWSSAQQRRNIKTWLKRVTHISRTHSYLSRLTYTLSVHHYTHKAWVRIPTQVSEPTFRCKFCVCVKLGNHCRVTLHDGYRNY